jgi:hypothetical protein
VARVHLGIVVTSFRVATVTPLAHRYEARTDANLPLRLEPPSRGFDLLGAGLRAAVDPRLRAD